MEIKITIEEEGEVIFRSDSLLVDSAVQDLYKFERWYEKQDKKEEIVPF